MRRILVSREFPPGPGGGIGTYARHVTDALAAAGDTVHVITQRWPGADAPTEVASQGRVVIHRIPVERPLGVLGRFPHPDTPHGIARELLSSGSAAVSFAWQAALLAEGLVEREGIELIEAPEYEAPLAFFQQRRAAGAGPAATPPCVVHLHSPSEFIAQSNDWDPASWAGAAQVQLEWASIRAADALICPSHYLARAVAQRISRPEEAIEVIRYPMPVSAPLLRSPSVWERGAVLYLGRLELRKGILEWLEAAVELATTDPSIHFAFVGRNHLDAQLDTVGVLSDRIPSALRHRFVFHPHRRREALRELLAAARLVVVPSRWENFPFTCLEAMASGVPVVASPTGGMAEMIDDARTGWVSASQSPEHLADAVREALDRSPRALAEAGEAAAESVRTLTDPQRIATQHAELADRLLRQGATRSLAPVRDEPAPARIPLAQSGDLPRVTCGIVAMSRDGRVDVTRKSIGAQQAAARELVSGSDLLHDDGTSVNAWLRQHGVIGAPAVRRVDAVALVPAGAAWSESALHRAAMVLRRHPEVGIVSGWVRRGDREGRLLVRPDPSLPHQWLQNDVLPLAVYRAEAIRRLGGVREELAGPAVLWDLATALMVDGWTALTLPEVFGSVPENVLLQWERVTRDEATRQHLMDRSPAVVARHAVELAELRALEERHGAIDAPSRLARIGRTLRRGARSPLRATRVLAQHLMREAR